MSKKQLLLTGDVNLMNIADPTEPFRKIVNELRATSSGNGTSLFTSEFSPGLYGLWSGYAVTWTPTARCRS